MSNAEHKGSVEALTTMMEIIDKFSDKIPEGDYLVMMDSLKTVYGYVLNQNPDDDESEDDESEEEESEEEGWGADEEAASCARYAAMAEGASAGIEGAELSAMVEAAVAAAQREYDALKAESAARTLAEETAVAVVMARAHPAAEEGWTAAAGAEAAAAADAMLVALREYHAAKAEREALAAQRKAMVAQRKAERERLDEEQRGEVIASWFLPSGAEVQVAANARPKMCECGCFVEERSRDTGEWWDYCNDCYEKDQADDETFICDECDHEHDWSLYVYFMESYDKQGEPYHPDDGGCPHRCINCHNDIVCERIIKFIDEIK